MNWTRLFPTLLAAHRQLGAVCNGSPSETASASSGTQGPALAMIAATVLAWGVFAPPLPCTTSPGLAQDGAHLSTSADRPVAARLSSDDTPASPVPNRPVPSVQPPHVPRVNLPSTCDCSDAPYASLFL